MKVVLDQCPCVRPALERRASPAWEAVLDGRFEAITSEEMLSELQDVLGRPKLQRRISMPGLTVEQLLTNVQTVCRVIQPMPVERTAPDLGDDKVIAAVLAGEANAIVTGDDAFLSLGHVQEVAMQTVGQTLTNLGVD